MGRVTGTDSRAFSFYVLNAFLLFIEPSGSGNLRTIKLTNVMKTKSFAENVIKYQAPQVEIIEVEVEKGFATSGNGGDYGDDNVPVE